MYSPIACQSDLLSESRVVGKGARGSFRGCSSNNATSATLHASCITRATPPTNCGPRSGPLPTNCGPVGAAFSSGQRWSKVGTDTDKCVPSSFTRLTSKNLRMASRPRQQSDKRNPYAISPALTNTNQFRK